MTVAGGISECERWPPPSPRPGCRELAFPYHPHVTVAHDVPPEALDKVYEVLADFSAMFEVDAFTLSRTAGRPGGSRVGTSASATEPCGDAPAGELREPVATTAVGDRRG